LAALHSWDQASVSQPAAAAAAAVMWDGCQPCDDSSGGHLQGSWSRLITHPVNQLPRGGHPLQRQPVKSRAHDSKQQGYTYSSMF